MIIIVANLRLGGFFQLANEWIIKRARYPMMLLAAIVLVSGTLSAFLVNDTICLVITPLVLDVTMRLKRDPVPYLLAVAVSSNIGSTATLTGNPQNMIVGNISGIAYADFSAALSPIAAVGLVLAIALIAMIYRKEFLSGEAFSLREHNPVRYHRPVVVKPLLVTAVMVALFFAGQPIAKVAIAGGAFMLFTRRIKAHKIHKGIDWPLLLMFSGLFVVVAGFERVALTPSVIAAVAQQHLENTGVLSLVTAALSNLVSNVPAVLILKPFVSNLADPQRAWLVVAMASTLAELICHGHALNRFEKSLDLAFDTLAAPVVNKLLLATPHRGVGPVNFADRRLGHVQHIVISRRRIGSGHRIEFDKFDRSVKVFFLDRLKEHLDALEIRARQILNNFLGQLHRRRTVRRDKAPPAFLDEGGRPRHGKNQAPLAQRRRQRRNGRYRFCHFRIDALQKFLRRIEHLSFVRILRRTRRRRKQFL